MASKKVTLYIRPVLSDGSRPYLRPAYLRGGKLREGYALVQGHPQQVPNAEYYVRYLKGGKRVWEQVGCDAGVALAAQQRISTRMAAVQAGNTIPEDNRSSLTVSRAIEPYLQHVANKGRAENTPKNYAFTLRHFARECNKPLHLITAEDLITFGGRMRDQGYADSTIHHHLVEIGTFLKHYGFKDVLPPGDLPKFVAKTADSYHQDDLTRFFAACDDDDDRLLFEFFLASGYRGGEVRYATWADVDFAAGTATVRAKRTRTLNWKPKDRDERTVPLPDALVERLRERRRLHPNAFYIFGDGRNRLPYPIRRLRGIAFRAGLNCRECITPDGQSCREHAVCYRWTLHKFRRTYATLQHEIGGVSARTLQSLLGHSKLETTLRYLAVTDSKSPRLRAQVNATFDGLVGGVQKIAAVLLLMLTFGAVIGRAQVPAKPGARTGKIDFALLTADASIRGLDVYSTHYMLSQGCHEILLPRAVADHTPAMAAYSTGAVIADWLVLRKLGRRHPRIARIIVGIDAAQDGYWAVHNFTLRGRDERRPLRVSPPLSIGPPRLMR